MPGKPPLAPRLCKWKHAGDPKLGVVTHARAGGWLQLHNAKCLGALETEAIEFELAALSESRTKIRNKKQTRTSVMGGQKALKSECWFHVCLCVLLPF